MTRFVLVPGAGGQAAYWNRLAAELQRRGHIAVPVDFAQDDPSLGLADWAATVVAAMGGHTDVLVAQSLGGFLAPVVGARARMIVLLNAMIPLPGEKIGDWWAATDSGAARRAADLAAGRDPDFDLDRHFLHDLPPDTRAELLASPAREPADTVWSEVCDFERWPDVPIKVLVGRDDRFFPAGFQRRVARERLGLDVDELAGGHLVALSNPLGLADRLVAYAGELPASS